MCKRFLFGLISSGCSVNTETKIDTKVYTNITNEILQRAAVRISDTAINIQRMRVTFGGEIRCKNLDINIAQKLNQNMTIVREVTVEQAANIANALKIQVQEDLKRIREIVTDIGGSDPDLEDPTTITKTINTIIDNKVTAENITDLASLSINEQTQEINLGPLLAEDCNLTFSQDMLVRIVSNQVVDVIQSSLLSNNVIKDFTTRINDTIKVEQRGLTAFFKGIFDGLANIVGSFGATIVLIIGGILALLVLVLIIYGISRLFTGGSRNREPPQEEV